MDGDAIAGLQSAEVAKNRGHLIDACVQLLVRQRIGGLGLRFRDENERRLVLVFGEMPIHAVEAGVEAAADEPLPERRIAAVERRVPVLLPVEQVGVFAEVLRKLVDREAVEDRRIGQIRLTDEFRRWLDVLLFLPVDRDFSFFASYNRHDSRSPRGSSGRRVSVRYPSKVRLRPPPELRPAWAGAADAPAPAIRTIRAQAPRPRRTRTDSRRTCRTREPRVSVR